MQRTLCEQEFGVSKSLGLSHQDRQDYVGINCVVVIRIGPIFQSNLPAAPKKLNAGASENLLVRESLVEGRQHFPSPRSVR